jgi:hypothetical protein
VTPAVLERGAARSRDAAIGALTLFDDVGGEPTLDALVSGMWEGLAAHRSVACPMCGGEMRPDYGAHALPIAGRCQNCETTLS